jgi:hypothetical protein
MEPRTHLSSSQVVFKIRRGEENVAAAFAFDSWANALLQKMGQRL